MDSTYSIACAMDASGFLSPKANAFSIAHLIDASQCIQDGACMRMNDLFNWSSQLLTKEMEGWFIISQGSSFKYRTTSNYCMELLN